MQPDFKASRRLLAAYGTDPSRCYTCGSCVTACPVGRATGKLRPVAILRLALLGQSEELLSSPEIWYCLECRQCGRDCPMGAQPHRLIEDLRVRAAFENRLPQKAQEEYQRLRAGLGRVRWRLAAACLQGLAPSPGPAEITAWAARPVPANQTPLRLGPAGPLQPGLAEILDETQVRRCFTCGECEGVCPAGRERGVFDPKSLFRLTLMGRIDEVLASPALWLCLQCGRCTSHCCQGVDGRQMLARLREMALSRGVVDQGFLERWHQAQKIAFGWYVDQVDALFETKAMEADAA